MKLGERIEKVVDIITEILAFLTVTLIVLLFINRFVAGRADSGIGFIPLKATAILESIREIAVLLVVALAGLQFALKRNVIIFILYALLVAVAVIFLFFPNVLTWIPASKSALIALGL